MYRYLTFDIGILIYLESGTLFCIGTSHIIVNPVPNSNFPNPSGGSAIYESGTGRILSFLEGTDPIFLIRIRELGFFYSVSVFSLDTDPVGLLT